MRQHEFPADLSAPSLPALWMRHKAECGSLGAVMKAARAGELPGVEVNGDGMVHVVDQVSALAAMKGKNS